MHGGTMGPMLILSDVEGYGENGYLHISVYTNLF